MAASKEGVVGRLYLEYQYFEAVQGFVQNPPRSNKDRQLFLAVLDACLDHVITASPSRLPTLLETLFPRFHGDEGVLLAVGKAFLRRRMHTEAEYFLQKVQNELAIPIKSSLFFILDTIGDKPRLFASEREFEDNV